MKHCNIIYYMSLFGHFLPSILTSSYPAAAVGTFLLLILTTSYPAAAAAARPFYTININL